MDGNGLNYLEAGVPAATPSGGKRRRSEKYGKKSQPWFKYNRVTSVFTGVRARRDCVREESVASQKIPPLPPWDLLFLRSSGVGAPGKRGSQEPPLVPARSLKPYIYHHFVVASFEKETLPVTPRRPNSRRRRSSGSGDR